MVRECGRSARQAITARALNLQVTTLGRHRVPVTRKSQAFPTDSREDFKLHGFSLCGCMGYLYQDLKNRTSFFELSLETLL